MRECINTLLIITILCVVSVIGNVIAYRMVSGSIGIECLLGTLDALKTANEKGSKDGE